MPLLVIGKVFKATFASAALRLPPAAAQELAAELYAQINSDLLQ